MTTKFDGNVEKCQLYAVGMSIETKDAIGQLVVDYFDNEKKIAALKSTIGNIGHGMREVGEDLWRFPEGVELTETGIVARHGVSEVLQRNFADVLYEAMDDLKVAMEVKARYEELLRQAGYGHVITSPVHGR